MTKFIETTDAASGTATTYTISVGDFLQGSMTSSIDSDWYRVQLTGGTTYSIAVTGTGSNNLEATYLEILDSSGLSLAGGFSSYYTLPNENSILTFTPTTTGTYYLNVESFFAPGSTYELTVTQGSKASFDLDMIAGVIDADYSWSAAPGTGAVVTYSFRASLPAGYTVDGSNLSTFTQVSAAQITAIQSILALYSEFTGVVFQRVNPAGYSNDAQMVFGNYFDPADGAGAFAFYPGGATGPLDYGGDVWMNTDSVSTTSLPFGQYSWHAIAHEIGHALGLSHPGLYNAAPGLNLTYANEAQFVQDSHQYTIMSYFDESNTSGNAGGYPDTPMIADVLALQNIYGANMTTRTSNTTYGFNNTTGNPIFGFATNTAPAFVIWDAGGTDTLDASGFAMDQTIRIGSGQFSNVGGLLSNISVAVGAVIENAIGGSGNDLIVGNSAANTLTGNNGNDTLDGGASADVMTGGQGNDTYIVDSASDSVIEVAGQGMDTVRTSLAYYVLDAGNTIENLIFTNAATLNIGVGNGLANAFTGTDGSDSFNGGGGADTFATGSGNDYIYIDQFDTAVDGGAGYDALFIQDTSSFTFNVGAAKVEWVYGWTGNNVLNAATAATGVALVGEAGADQLTGSAFNDYIYFDSLDTVVNAGAGYDAIFVYQGNGQGIINTTINVVTANAEWVLGGAGDDTIFNTGRNVSVTLSGGAGNDTITGGLASDYFYGNAGSDIFVVTANAQYDSIYDMTNGVDKINVHALGAAFDTFAEVLAVATGSGGSTTLNFGGGNSLFLYNFAIGNLDASDFVF